MKAFKHFKTIIIHKHYVGLFCRKLGIGWQGFWHDMSKFSPVEFWESVKYYSGTRSPIDACKEDKGYSLAWQHHKGRNMHHYEFWQDNFDKGTTHLLIPDKYIKEMICDFLGAGRAYKGKEFTFQDEWDWWLNKTKNPIAMHEQNWNTINCILRELTEEFGMKKIPELTRKDWKTFRRIVNDTIGLVRE